MLKKYSCLLLILFLSVVVHSHKPHVQQYVLTRKNEDIRINKIFQDRAGFIWCGTSKGLFRLDGIRQVHYSSRDTLIDESITAIAESPDGVIWAGHGDGKISFIRNDSITLFNPEEGSSNERISDILFDKQGNMWFSTCGDGLYYIYSGRMYRLDEQEGMPDLFIYDLTEDNHGRIWAGTDAGAVIITLKDSKPTLEILDDNKGLPDKIVKKILEDGYGNILIAMEDSGIVGYEINSGRFSNLLDGRWSYGSIMDFEPVNDKVWIATAKNGIVILDKKTSKIKIYNEATSKEFGRVTAIRKDNESNIWIGSKSGLLRTPGDHFEFIDAGEEGSGGNIVAVSVDHNNTVWYATGEGLFKRIAESDGKAYSKNILKGTAFSDKKVISLYCDERGDMWAGLYGEGVLRINHRNGRISQVRKELRDGNILGISGHHNEIWLATLGGGSRIIINGENYTVENYSTANGLSTDYIYNIYVDSNKRVWFGTDGKGVDMFDGKQFHHFTRGLNSRVIYGICEDKEKNIWVNEQGYGLYKLIGDSFSPVKSSTPITDNNVQCIMADENGNIIAFHDLGIDIYDKKGGRFHYFGSHAGLQNRRANLNAIAKDKNNRIYFGTNNGIVCYSTVPENYFSQPVPIINGLRVSNKNMQLSNDLVFKYDQNDLTIQFLGVWYQNPEDLSYKYKLENFDKEFITTGERSVTYSSLPPGQYRFRVLVSDNNDFSHAKEASFSFTVNPPFWQTAWFYIIVGLTTVACTYLYIKQRERKLRNDKKVLESKNAELKKTNMELDRFVYCVSHDLRAPLSSMLGVVEISEEDNDDPVLSTHLGMLKNSIQKLDGFIEDILNYSRNSRLDIEPSKIDFKEMLNDITQNLKHMASGGRQVNISLDVSEPVLFCSDRSRVNIVLNNIISNAIRYQKPEEECPSVAIEVTTNEQEACIRVKDNGIGIKKENHQKIFDMFYRLSDVSVGSGLGLYIVKETIDKLNGRIEIESEFGKGTEFSVYLPNHLAA